MIRSLTKFDFYFILALRMRNQKKIRDNLIKNIFVFPIQQFKSLKVDW